MQLTPREKDKLLIAIAAEVVRAMKKEVGCSMFVLRLGVWNSESVQNMSHNGSSYKARGLSRVQVFKGSR